MLGGSVSKADPDQIIEPTRQIDFTKYQSCMACESEVNGGCGVSATALIAKFGKVGGRLITHDPVYGLFSWCDLVVSGLRGRL